MSPCPQVGAVLAEPGKPLPADIEVPPPMSHMLESNVVVLHLLKHREYLVNAKSPLLQQSLLLTNIAEEIGHSLTMLLVTS